MATHNIDEYITRFKKMAQQAGYPLDASLTIDLFTSGVPKSLYEQAYNLDSPHTLTNGNKC